MARYIDADKINYTVRSFYDGHSIEGEIILKVRAVAFESDIDEMPVADVAPKSEVAREIFEEIEKLHLHITNEFDVKRYAELKKKYTEGDK